MPNSMLLLSVFFVIFSGLFPDVADGTGMPPMMMSCCPPPAPPPCCAPPPPPPPPPPPCGGCCGGCGRRKRQAIHQFLLKGKETPCPQAEWRQLIQEAIVPSDDIGSVNTIQSALSSRFTDKKFIVMCALAGGGGQQLPNQVHLSSNGNGYCNVVSGRIWCQAAAMVS